MCLILGSENKKFDIFIFCLDKPTLLSILNNVELYIYRHLNTMLVYDARLNGDNSVSFKILR